MNIEPVGNFVREVSNVLFTETRKFIPEKDPTKAGLSLIIMSTGAYTTSCGVNHIANGSIYKPLEMCNSLVLTAAGVVQVVSGAILGGLIDCPFNFDR